MKDIQAIARYMRLPEDQLKFPIELLNQGYEPNYLANYRPDELGSIDEQTLSILQRALIYSEALKHHKEKVQQTLEREQHWNETVASVVSQSNTISQVDTVTRQLRARRNSRSVVEACPQVEIIGQAILTLQGDAPKDMIAWTAETASVPLEQAEEVLNNTKRWMVHLLSEDVRLIQDLQRTLLKKASSISRKPRYHRLAQIHCRPSSCRPYRSHLSHPKWFHRIYRTFPPRSIPPPHPIHHLLSRMVLF
jgi:protein Tex